MDQASMELRWTMIRYAVAPRTRVDIAIYDVRGQRVRRLASDTAPAPGSGAVVWNVRDDKGARSRQARISRGTGPRARGAPRVIRIR